MINSKQSAKYFQAIRRLHRLVAPIMLLPLLLTAMTGTIYQIGDLSGKDRELRWLLGWHKGNFEFLNLEMIYPFLNAIGLCILLFTVISMWLNLRQMSKKQST